MKLIKKQNLRIFFSMLLIVMACSVTGCGNENDQDVSRQEGEQNTDAQKEKRVLGEGDTQFVCSVTDKDGEETVFEIHTDKETVGAALLEHDLIAGEESSYGLYVKTVNGITADYDTDGYYWAFYINDEYALTGVDSTPITAGETYAFRMETA